VIVYRSTEIDDAGHLHERGGVYRSILPTKLNEKKLIAGDILIEASGGAPDRPVGRAALFSGLRDEPAIGANFLRTLRPKKTVCGSFLRWLLVALQQQPAIWRYQQQTTGMINLKVRDYLNHRIDVPPLSQQRRIAEILSTVDEAIEQTEALIAKYQQVKAGLMHDLFTRGLSPEASAKGDVTWTLRPTRAQAPHLYKESPLGWIPKEWECLTIEDLLAKTFSPMRSGPFGSALLKDELIEDGIPFLGIDNVYAECFVPIYRRFISHQKFVELIRYAVFPGDVIITIMGTVGRCCVVPDYLTEALSSKHLWTMTFDDSRVFPELVCWQLNHARWVKDWFARYSQGAVMEAIQSSTLRSLQLPVPKIDEQKLIVSRYRGCTHLIEMEETHAAKLQQEKHGLMHDLLTGRVRVKVAEPVGGTV
jgi:type I restriction enzyme S subunit